MFKAYIGEAGGAVPPPRPVNGGVGPLEHGAIVLFKSETEENLIILFKGEMK